MSKANDDLFKRSEKINAELFALTYGALVVQLIKDHEDLAVTNAALDRMGYNIGCRLIDDFLARSASTGLARCANFHEVGDVLSKVAFKAFLNVSPAIVHSSTAQEFTLMLEDNPLAEFVELPEDVLGDAQSEGLWYSNVLCGVIRGALEMIQYQVTVHFVSDVLRGDDNTAIRVQLTKRLDEEAPPAED